MGIDQPPPEVTTSVNTFYQPVLVSQDYLDNKSVKDCFRYYDVDNAVKDVQYKTRLVTDNESQNVEYKYLTSKISCDVDNLKIEDQLSKSDILKFSCVDGRSRVEMRRYCVEILKRMNHSPHIRITTQDISAYCKHRRIN